MDWVGFAGSILPLLLLKITAISKNCPFIPGKYKKSGRGGRFIGKFLYGNLFF
jgi:hypothetical protein